jgi:hypothetical protein
MKTTALKNCISSLSATALVVTVERSWQEDTEEAETTIGK